MQGVSPHSYTFDHEVDDDGTVTFRCSTATEKWPWLELHPFDPIVVQSINFWASVETATARGTWDPDKWSALTHITWQCGRLGVGHAVRGIGKQTGGSGSPGFQIRFFDAKDALVYQMDGIGVIFQNRDFEAWRAKAKQKAPEAVDVSQFEFANVEQVGLADQSHCFVSPLVAGDQPAVQAMVPKATGFMPQHPYHSGSGDHVNSNQLADVVRQFVNLWRGEIMILSSGTIEFNRYVELDRPFNVRLISRDENAEDVEIVVEQSGRQCALFEMKIYST
ncbi:MAG: hypothetical protein ABJN65_00690 [Parasphingorhabdus sp.]